MGASTIGMIQAILSAAFWLTTLGLLIWLLVKAHSSAKVMAAVGLGLMLLAAPISTLASLLYVAMGMVALVLVGALSGAMNAAGLVLLVMAFMRIDPVAAPVERRSAANAALTDAGPQPEPWQAPTQSPYTGPASYPGNPGGYPAGLGQQPPTP